MPTLQPIPLWQKLSDPTHIRSLHHAGETASYANAVDFWTDAKNNASWVAGNDLFVRENGTGNCWRFVGTNTLPYVFESIQLDAAGITNAVCIVPPVESWDCVNNICVDPLNGNGTYSTLAACQTACRESWNCVNNVCTDPLDGTGTYTSLTTCQSNCYAPSWNCNNGVCSDPGTGNGTYTSLTACQTNCYIPSWNCNNGVCHQVNNASGTYATLAACNAACFLPTWNCVAGVCTQVNDGTGMYTTLTSCQTNCTTAAHWYNWKRYTACNTPPTYSVTSASITATITVQRQGSYSFWVNMGSPTIGQFIKYTVNGVEECWEYMGYTQDAVGSSLITYNIPIPSSINSTFYTTCIACLGLNTYDCINGNCVAVSGSQPGPYATMQECTAACVPIISGCTDPTASNYDATATVDDGSCTYTISGCKDPTANNYNPAATVDDGSCTYTQVVLGCTDPTALNYNSLATQDAGSCTYCVYGCMDASATNYDANATCDDGSCLIIEGGTSCDIEFGPEVCQPNGTSTVNIDLSAANSLNNVVTTVNGTIFGTPTICDPVANISVTGLTTGETIKVVGECSYAKEDYNSSLTSSAPDWAAPECGQTTIDSDTLVYVFYDGTSMGNIAAKNAYKSVMAWLKGYPDFTVNTSHVGIAAGQNVFHIAVAGERWLDWGTSVLTGKFNNNNATQNYEVQRNGVGGLAATTYQSITFNHCNGGSACNKLWNYEEASSTYNTIINAPYDGLIQGARMIDITNWAYDTITETDIDASGISHTWNVDEFYDTAEGALIGTQVPQYVLNSRCTGPTYNLSGQTGATCTAWVANGNQKYLGFPPVAPIGTKNILVIAFADESTFSYHKGGSPNFNIGETNVTWENGSGNNEPNPHEEWKGVNMEQPTPAYKSDYTEFTTQRNIHIAGGKTFQAFLYPSKASCSSAGGQKNFPLHALAAISSGNKTVKDGMWLSSTAPDNACNTTGDKLSLIETENPYWSTTTPTWGGLDQKGWGVNVAELPFVSNVFQNDLEEFLGLSSLSCNDSQCLVIKVVNENDLPINNYPIKVNGINIGTTDIVGVLTHTLTGPGPIIINNCYTFTAVGGCLQTLITIVITENQYTASLNCILGCTDPLSFNYNPLAGIDDGSCLYPLTEDPRDSMLRCELLKIDTECQFATDLYNIYKHDRFGFERACLNNIEGHIIKKYTTDWVDNLLPDHGAETMSKTLYTKGTIPKPNWVDEACGGEPCDGSECIVVIVKNKKGEAIQDYEIVLDGLYAGKTDEYGQLKISIPNAAEDRNHKLNLCHCFTTTGGCNSQRIKLIVDGVSCDDCGNIKIF